MAMPTDKKYTDKQIIDGLSETAKTVNRLMLTLLALGLFSLLAIGQPDAYLLNPAATVRVPSIGAASAKSLLIVGPLLLIGVRIYLQIYVEHWRNLDAMAIAKNIKRAAIVSPMRHKLLRLLAGAVLYILVPAALIAFTWKAMAIPKWWGYGLLIVTVFVSAAHALQDMRRKWTVRLYYCTIIAAVFGVVGGAAFLEELRRPFDLRYANLSQTDLAGIDLRGADMRRANLNGADLSFAQLQGADLTRAQLKEANFTAAELQKADLSGAQLQKAFLGGAKLQGATLVQAQLQGANLSAARLQRADLSSAQLQKAILTQAQLWNAILSKAQLQGANLSFAQLQGAYLREAQLQKANLTLAQLQRADLRRAHLQGANLFGAELQRANLQRTNLTLTNFADAKGLTLNSVKNACYRPKNGIKGRNKLLGPPTNLPDGITIPPCKKKKP